MNSTQNLCAVKENLLLLRGNLRDVNSVFPPTREFLKKRGLSHVSELDKKARAELLAHLCEKVRLLYS